MVTYYKDGTMFGMSSKDEMCISYVNYPTKKGPTGEPWARPWYIEFGVETECAEELT